MSIRPIDMQVMIPKSTEVSKISHTENQRPIQEQQLFANQLEQQATQNQQKVMYSDKTEKGEIKDREGRNRREAEKKKKKKEQDEKENKKPIGSTSIFDVKI